MSITAPSFISVCSGRLIYTYGFCTGAWRPIGGIIGKFGINSLLLRIKTPVIIIHLAGWLLFFSLPLLFVYGLPGNSKLLSNLLAANSLLFYTCYIVLFYLNTGLLIPKLYLQKRYLAYGAVLAVLLVVVCLLRPFDRLIARSFRPHEFSHEAGRFPGPSNLTGPGDPPGPGTYLHGPAGSASHVEKRPMDGPPMDKPDRRIDVVSIFLFLMLMALGIAIKISEQLRKTEQRVVQAEADKANAELSFLKAQINPHFLFNTLNNIYSLAVTGSEHTADSIMKLSNIMRYVTDDISEDYTSLQSEIDCISDYIDLQRLRLGKNGQIDFRLSGPMENRKIAPLILMPFVENVFKYGISKQEPSPVDIRVSSEQQTISFYCSNRIFPDRKTLERTGIGLSNTRQRLEYLYPDKYFLNISTDNELYTVRLTLQVV